MTWSPASRRGAGNKGAAGMSAEKLPVAYWCPECHEIFEGMPDQDIAWDVHNVESLGTLDITFSQPYPMIVYTCKNKCRSSITATFVHAWRCRNCKTIYEDRDEAQECCP